MAPPSFLFGEEVLVEPLELDRAAHADADVAPNTIVPTTDTYAAAYATLSAIAARLKAPTGAASIDNLARDVREARHLFTICSKRLAAIRAEIEAESLDDTEEG